MHAFARQEFIDAMPLLSSQSVTKNQFNSFFEVLVLLVLLDSLAPARVQLGGEQGHSQVSLGQQRAAAVLPPPAGGGKGRQPYPSAADGDDEGDWIGVTIVMIVKATMKAMVEVTGLMMMIVKGDWNDDDD